MVLKSAGIFILAGLCEIGGGYLVWLWMKEQKPWWYGAVGAMVLIFYGLVATWQPANFARTYATYGGVFIVMSIAWAMIFDHFVPDRYDVAGALVALAGACIICYAPRG